jgi:phosphoadenosine phosphosulfate reductase
MDKIQNLKSKIAGCSSLDILDILSNLEEEKLTFSTSLGYEDQVITDYISNKNINTNLFSLDTGRLFPETYSVLQKTIERYKLSIQIYFPETKSVEDLLTEKGPLSFYESIENRKECCLIRKVEPLKRALKGYTIWITGIRKEQSKDREDIEQIEWDSANQIIKVHPLLHWTIEEVKNYIKEHNIPYNSLHDNGFVSIGCQPCTRSVKEGEDFRAGRWWWEDETKKECGLHFK